MKDISVRPHIGTFASAMCGNIQPIAIPIILFVRILTAMDPNLQTIELDVRWTEIVSVLFNAHV
jgi:hypothetical protein